MNFKGFVGNPDINKEYRDFIMGTKLPLMASQIISPVVALRGVDVVVIPYSVTPTGDTIFDLGVQVPQNTRYRFISQKFICGRVGFHALDYMYIINEKVDPAVFPYWYNNNHPAAWTQGESYNISLVNILPELSEGWKFGLKASGYVAEAAAHGAFIVERRRG